jgi:hypothetical protein
MTYRSRTAGSIQAQADRERVREYLQGRSATTYEMRAALGMTSAQIGNALRHMRKHGLAQSYDNAVWALTGHAPAEAAELGERRQVEYKATPDGTPRVIHVQARQLGLRRDDFLATLFGPAP